MALDTEEVKIGDLTFRITQMPSRKALRMFTRLSKLVGPALGALKPGTGGKEGLGLDSKLDDIGLGEALAVLCDQLDEDDVDAIFEAFGEFSTVNQGGKSWPKVKDVFDVLFAGQLHVAFQWLGHSLRVNFSSFLGDGRLSSALGSLVAARAEKPGEKPPSPKG